jgi:histidinol-phosphatase
MGIILPEAGGRFSAVDGSDSIEAGNAISSNGHLHERIVARLKG